jgi:hypothetical protein
MIVSSRRTVSTMLLSLAVAWGVSGCGSDDNGGTGPGVNSAVVGTWNATSFVPQGSGDLIAQGMSLSFTFAASGDYTFTITNDQGGLCDGAANCSDGGSYTASGTQITLDPGTVDVAILNYTIVGNTMTITATIDGVAITASFTKQ